MRSRLVTAAFPFMLMGAAGADVVRIAPEEGDGPPFGLEGQIVDYTGSEIVIRPARGAERRYPALRVAEIQTAWPAGYEEGRQALQRKDYAAAGQHFMAANQAEVRPWARRIILGDLAQALLGQGRVEQAGEIVLAILSSDRTSPHLDLLPLAWTSETRVPQAKAEAWLARANDPPANLLGASCLMSTARQAEAVAVLGRLTADADVRIASLAEAQLWRTRLASADAADVRRWQGAIEKMPVSLRAGPYFMVGQEYRRLGRTDEAVLSLLRVPIHASQHAELAARSLLDAAELLGAAGQRREAVRLAREVVTDYSATASAKPAEAFLQELHDAKESGATAGP
jgi:hypothetical protein